MAQDLASFIAVCTMIAAAVLAAGVL